MLLHKPSKLSPNPQLKSSWHVNFIKLAQMKRIRRKEDNSVIPFLLLFRVNHFFSTTLPP